MLHRSVWQGSKYVSDNLQTNLIEEKQFIGGSNLGSGIVLENWRIFSNAKMS